MSYAEYTRWLAYRKKHGPLDFERRYDRPAALIAQQYAQFKTRQPVELSTFMPWSEREDTPIDELAKAFGATRKR